MRIAALDLGSNSFHLIVAEINADGSFRPLVGEKEMLRLGDVVGREGTLTPAAADQAVATVRRFRMLAEAAGATEIVACATSAIRTASNGSAVVDRIEAETGVDVEVISGMREAELIFGAVRASVLIEPAPALCFDLGGGSVEITVGDARGLQFAASEKLGVGRLTADFVSTDPISKDERKALRRRIVQTLRPIARRVAELQPRMVVGSSGTFEDIGHMIAARRDADVPVSLNQLRFARAEFDALHKILVGSKASERRKLEGLEARRVDLIPAGSMFLATIMELFEFDEMVVSEWALREGILLDAIGHHDPADWSDDPRAIRRASVQGLARRCSWPEAHSRHVAKLALELFDQTTELHELGPVDRELLEYAALLHDIGEHVSVDAHHRHAAYLIRNGQLRGFDPTEVVVLAAIARWHRRGEPKESDESFGALTEPDRERVRRLVALLRVADGLDRSRSATVASVTAEVGPSLALLRLRTDGDAELEVWGARRKRELFERVFGRELEITAYDQGP
ncbi:MAG: Ppx/GppA phosphatase family protein [Acidimicrobiia bacterium]